MSILTRWYSIRSKWDYLSFVAVFQWILFGAAVALLGLDSVIGAGSMEAGILLVGVLFLNVLSGPAVFISIFFGRKYHPKLDPGWLYLLLSFLFAPIVGVLWLRDTGFEQNALN